MNLEPDPLISIFCLTYNHGSYIAQALDGFLIQQTNFRYEVFVYDDASSDQTQNIIKEYEEKYNNIFPVFEPENKLSKGKNEGLKTILPKCRGKYIAVCEGDDYWIDKFKLQRQADFMENNPDFSMCFTDRMIVDSESKILRKSSVPENKKKHLTAKEILGGFTPPTQTVVFRKSLLINEAVVFDSMAGVYNGDTFLFSFLSTKGKVGYIDIISAVYRINEAGIYSSIDFFQRLRKKLRTQVTLRKVLPDQFQKHLAAGLKITYQRLFIISMKNFRLIEGFIFLVSLIRLDLITKDISTVRAFRLLFKSIIKKDFVITD